MKAIYGRKVGMTRVYTENGQSVAVTVLECVPNVIHQVKTTDSDSYNAVQVGFGGEQKPQRVARPLLKHLGKAEKGIPKQVREIRLTTQNGGVEANGQAESYNVGDTISIEGMFDVGSRVDVVGTSLGKGFAGVMKRHHMKGAQTNTHGTHEYFRHGGSIGCRKFPGRVFKNKRMAGHMGVDRVMQQGLEVVAIRPNENLLLVKGSVPGPKDGVVFVRQAVKGY